MAVVDARKEKDQGVSTASLGRGASRVPRYPRNLSLGSLTVNTLSACLDAPSVSPMRPAPLFLE